MKDRKKIGITSDSLCDLPLGMQELHDINLVYYYVENSNGRFRDMDEVTSENVLEYMEGGEKKIQLDAPSITDYKNFFKKYLSRFDEIIHLSTASTESNGFERATEAVKELGEHGNRVHVVDTKALSGAMSLMALYVQNLIDLGKNVNEILYYLEANKPKYKALFYISDPYFLFLSKRISKFAYTIMNFFQIHPLIEFVDGKIKVKSILMGSQEKSLDKFAKKAFPRNVKLDNRKMFISYCDIPLKRLETIKQEIVDRFEIKDMVINKTSATLASCLGNFSMGVFYIAE